MTRTARKVRPCRPVSIERLEERALLSTTAAMLHHSSAYDALAAARRPASAVVAASVGGYAHTFLTRDGGPGGGGPLSTSVPSSALTPAELRHIYALDQISNLGAGQTIAIVDAYDDPYIASDADTFDKQFMTTLGGSTSYYSAYGAASTWLTKAYASGSKPRGNTGWGQEISLDVEWAHAVAPQAKILLVEAASTSFSSLLAADDYAVSHGATVVSNSWGGGEFSSEASYDSHFQASGVTFVFSAGDSGNQSYPAESPYVVSVGGTLLSHDSSYNWTGESGWTSGGGGVSGYESSPSYQAGLGYAKRANPDVAYNGDPNSGVAVYDSYGNYGWGQYGGTSAGAPQWSAIIALANQGRVAAGKSVLTGSSQVLPALYGMSSSTSGTTPLYDVTTGSNSVASAGPGYDLVTGKGTPRRADLVYAALVNY